MNKVVCSKCDGLGKIQGYSHIKNGVCFQCEGLGYQLLSDKQLKRIEKEYNAMNEAMKREEEEREKERLEELKQIEEEKEQKERNIKAYQDKLSFVGSIGESVEMKLKLKFRKELKYRNNMYVLEDENRNNVMFYSKDIYTVLDEFYHVKGIVKEHKKYNGYKQTVLDKIKVLNEVDFSELSDEEIDALEF